jgi:hypothetical protein
MKRSKKSAALIDRARMLRVAIAAWRFYRAFRAAKIPLGYGKDHRRIAAAAMCQLGRMHNYLHLGDRADWVTIAIGNRGKLFWTSGPSGDDVWHYRFHTLIAKSIAARHPEWGLNA